MKDWFKAEVLAHSDTPTISNEAVRVYVNEILLTDDIVSDDLRSRLVEGLEAFVGATLCRVNRVN